MASYERHAWQATHAGATRRERRGCVYEAYLPDGLAGRPWQLDGDVAADIADAEAAILAFNQREATLSDTEGLARLLLRAEAVASSRIEGLVVGPRRILKAELARDLGGQARDVQAEEILGNIRAMQAAVGAAATGEVTVETLLAIHSELLRGTAHGASAGSFRLEQNWIGGSSFNPCGASYIPPPPEHVPELMRDLVRFCSSDHLSPLSQAAIAHAQFETIHPFADGNGRTGRALIHLILRRRGLAPRFVPPVSLVLATWSDQYISALTATRYAGPPESDAARAGVNHWLGVFAAAARRAVADADAYEGTIGALQRAWRKRLGRVRADSSLDRLLWALPGIPVFTVRTVEELIGRSFEAANQSVARLVEAGIATQTALGRRNRAFEVPELIDAFIDLERTLASPAGDTRAAAPSRPAPSRRPPQP